MSFDDSYDSYNDLEPGTEESSVFEDPLLQDPTLETDPTLDPDAALEPDPTMDPDAALDPAVDPDVDADTDPGADVDDPSAVDTDADTTDTDTPDTDLDASQDDIDLWHQQQSADTCAVVGQEFLLDRFTGEDHSEEELVAVAEANDWYRPGGGTPMEDVGNLLEYYDVPVERTQGDSIDDLESSLSDGDGVLVAVDSGELLPDDPDGEALADASGIPGQGADHVVQVIGFDRSDPDDPQVILNDPGRADGAGLEVPEADFLNAWEDSGRYTVTASGSSDV
ncbi:C39 family peptidase [Streptomyces atriruber]|uniref:C39 family peptidase n=1 Tax=Streptomyces atriruber TaxID=545121 RepID=A0ABV3BYB5_9ACTN